MHGYEEHARGMVEKQLRHRGVVDAAVLSAMEGMPRHRFVPELDPKRAYADQALPTAEGQTISQPYIVALMSEMLDVRPKARVLEIGTGSGYQTAILAELGASVVSIERREFLARFASRLLEGLGYGDRVEIHTGDGTQGHPPGAPYDRILVTAAAPHLPGALREQLVDGGRIVIPLGERHHQRLVRFDRDGDHWHRQEGTACRFVSLIGDDAWPD